MRRCLVIMKKIRINIKWLACMVGIGLLAASGAWGAVLSLSGGTVAPAADLAVEVGLDKAENLAGMKLVLSYDPELLIFKEAQKSPAARAMMFMVNDKTPGRLILVMAAAQGIQGEPLQLVKMRFTAAGGLKKAQKTRITVQESQLMSDQLQEIAHAVESASIQLSAPPDPSALNQAPPARACHRR